MIIQDIFGNEIKPGSICLLSHGFTPVSDIIFVARIRSRKSLFYVFVCTTVNGSLDSYPLEERLDGKARHTPELKYYEYLTWTMRDNIKAKVTWYPKEYVTKDIQRIHDKFLTAANIPDPYVKHISTKNLYNLYPIN